MAFPTLYDYCLELETRTWEAWEWLVPQYEHDRGMRFSSILVPTVDTLRLTWLIKIMESIIQQMNFSSRTSSMDVQRNLESVVEKRTKDTFGPPVGKKMLVFIDDMNMPIVDTYGTQQPIALLKLLFERKGFYDRGKDLNWKHLKDIGFLAAMGKAARALIVTLIWQVDPRFISMFSVYNLQFPSESTLQRIYISILQGHFAAFPEEIQEIVDKIVQMTLDLYKIIIVELPPTPAKFHYIFNLRDLSRIAAGMCLTHPNFFSEKRAVVRCWRNEFTRVICDRLINTQDNDLMMGHIQEHVVKYFPEEEPVVLEEIVVPEEEARVEEEEDEYGEIVPKGKPQPAESEPEPVVEEEEEEEEKQLTLEEYVLRDPLLFGDYRNALDEEEIRYYEDLLDYEAVYFLFQEILDEFNERIGKMSVVLFEDCLEHLTRTHRILRMDRGNAMIIGVGGSGKKSICRLAAFAAGCEVFEITVTRNYNENTFKDDMKRLYNQLGVDGKPTVFLFTAAQILEEGFLEFINNILMIGMIPALFGDDEKDAIINAVRNESIEAGFGVAKDAVWNFFCNKCANNLHVVLSMSPSGDILRNRFVLYCIVYQVEKIPEEFRSIIVEHVVHVHMSVARYSAEFLLRLRRNNYVTPKHYMDFLTNYLSLLNEKDAFIVAQKVIVAEQTKECEILLKEISVATEAAVAKQQVAEVKSAEITEQSKVIVVEKTEAEEALSAALPALEAARLALADLDKNDITEIRSFATPPEAVQVVCECVVIIRGIKDVSWKGAKGMMADPNFLRNLQEMNCDLITQAQVKAVKAHMKKSKKLDTMQQISKAGYGLLKFVIAVLGYCAVYREVKPKKDKVEALEKEYSEACNYLASLNREIDRLQRTLNGLNTRYDTAMLRRQELQEETDIMMRRLVAADKLMSGLSSEQKRWTIDLAALYVEQSRLIGNCLLAASFLSYTGPFSFSFRETMIYEDWLGDIMEKGIPLTTPFTIEKNLTNEVEISGWNSEGLPPDELSVQNGILTTRASRFPLCIDPQTQALTWIKKKEAKNNLKVRLVNDIVKNKAVNGYKFVNFKQYRIINSEVDYDPHFRMYLTTKLANPQFNPSAYAKAVVINYTVTVQVMEKLELAEATTKDIEKLRDGYRPVAKRGSILFFVLSDMAGVSTMYQYSLSSYLDVRIFERHKLLFSFQMDIKLEQSEGHVSQMELDFFIKGNVSLEKSPRACPASWIPAQGWQDIMKLSTDFPESFASLPDHITRGLQEWQEWFDSDAPESAEIPDGYRDSVNPFQLLMLLRCFRVDRIYRALTDYITVTMGEEYITPPVISFEMIFEQTTPFTPVVFILSPGSDPTADLMKLADRCGFGGGKFKYLSLGQGQEGAALALLEGAISHGQWLILQNCHLLVSFLRELEKQLELMEKPHPEYRLWLTTDPTPTFPIGILQRSLKVVTEPPNGLKLNLRNTYFKMRAHALSECPHPAFKKLVYVLAFFHAVVQERRKYDKIGWNIAYDFSESDFVVCMQILQCYLERCYAVMYGGRVIDDFDRRVVGTYMEEYLGDFLFDKFQPFHFYHDSHYDYIIPPDGERDEYIGEGGGTMSREEFIDSVAVDILGTLPVQYEVWRVRKQFEMNITPTTVVLLQELERFNRLIAKMSSTLSLLRKALAGEIGMDAVLDNVAYCLFNGQLPQVWRNLAPATCKGLGGWMDHFNARTRQYTNWSTMEEPIVIWLSGLHIPESYLIAHIQIACRLYTWPLDRSTQFTKVTSYVTVDDIEERPVTGCYVRGLYLEGARWDLEDGCLRRSHPKVLVTELPIMYIIPIEAHKLKLQNTLRTPVYTTSQRRNAMGVGLVFESDLWTTEHPSHWVLQGVCLIMNTD
ncbi:unnamed protein product [Leptidea sinapis]|uniref:Dynein heavy chain 10, axonemal n=1 Tax=Leptidea sinapis TaxID=189913 RepID=A0A5E4QR50_9NEOP|nr:unnamed protein product [Leptidea sinapis]